jgi:UDP-N-acetyl-D-mannosaminuronate dehydrogenase
MSEEIVIVAGLGEVGRPLLNILNRNYDCIGIDVRPVDVDRTCSVLHVCYPFQIRGFVGTTVAYIDKFKPKLTIINSTVAVGTTRKVQEMVATPIAYSPVRGKHAKMEQDMLHYQKFVVGTDSQSTQLATQHLAGAGFKVATFPTPEAGEARGRSAAANASETIGQARRPIFPCWKPACYDHRLSQARVSCPCRTRSPGVAR